jgi:hypothetical protein
LPLRVPTDEAKKLGFSHLFEKSMDSGFLFLAPLLIAFPANEAAANVGSSVVEIARNYDDGGGYDNSWKGSGVPAEIRFKDERILAKGNGSFCCGFTFAVAMDAATARGLLRDKSVDEVRAFQKQWYGATEESREIQCALAIETLGIGERVEADKARAGDFLQFWRTNKSGHSVMFLEWIEDDSKRIGFKYRSSQGSTKGIGDQAEYFAGTKGNDGGVDPKRMYFCRLNEAAE